MSEPTAKLGRCDPYRFSKASGKSGLCFIAHGQSDIVDTQLHISQQRLGVGDALAGQPSVWRLSGGHTEGRTEVESAQVYQVRQFLNADILRHILAHIAGDALDLPTRKTTLRSRRDRH